MSKSLLALIVITAPKNADMSQYWDRFFDRYPNGLIDQDDRVRKEAYRYLAEKLDSIKQ